MGSLCSKSSVVSGGHTVLSSAPRQGQPSDPDHTRQAAAEAAERRRKAERERGINASNPRKGELARKLEDSRTAPRVPEPRQEERLVWE